MGEITLTLLTRAGCHLCDEMAAIARDVGHKTGAVLEVRDVDRDPALRHRYGELVPALLIDDRLAFKYRLTARALERRINGAKRRRRTGSWLQWPHKG